MAKNNLESLKKAQIARIWQGRTTNARADNYERYVYEAGIKKIAGTEGNLGVQLMRHSKNGITEFITISYWASREDIKRYAGEDIEKPPSSPEGRGIFARTAGIRQELRFNKERLEMNKDSLFIFDRA